MESGGSSRIHKGSPIIPILSLINPIPRFDTYLFEFHSNIVLPSKNNNNNINNNNNNNNNNAYYIVL